MDSQKLKRSKKVFYEFLSIFFAVFLGYMANQLRDQYNNQKLADKSIENIKAEVDKNIKNYNEMIINHKKQIAAIDKIINQLNKGVSLDSIDMRIDLSFKLIETNSWETAKITQAVAYMDFKLVSEVAAVYEIQEYYKNKIKNATSVHIYEDDDTAHAQKSIVKSLKEIKNLIRSITPLEEQLYKDNNLLLKTLNAQNS
jgi:uncharacterized protein YqfB (UPF0267 family)